MCRPCRRLRPPPERVWQRLETGDARTMTGAKGMDIEMKSELGITVERLAAAAGLLEQAVERLAQRQSDSEESIGRIVATVEARREAELEEKLAAAEAEIAELRAAAASVSSTVTHGRKTLPAGMATLLAKQG